MNALETVPSPPTAQTTAGGNDLLDALVQAHLQRASEGPGRALETPTAPVEEEGAVAAGPEPTLADVLTSNPNAPQDETAVPEILQREISALLQRDGSEAAAPAEEAAAATAGTDELSVEELRTLLTDSAPGVEGAEGAAPVAEAVVSAGAGVETRSPAEIFDSTPPTTGGISNEELAALMTDLTGGASPDAPNLEALAASAAAEAAAERAVVSTGDEFSATLDAAEKALAAELATLMAEKPAGSAPEEQPRAASAAPTAAVAAVAAAKPEEETTAAATVAAEVAEVAEPEGTDLPPADMLAPALELPPCVIVELPEEDPEAEPGPVPAHRLVTAAVHDVGLLLAQLLDTPFAWMDLVDKNLLGLVAAILLLSGVALKMLAWRFMH